MEEELNSLIKKYFLKKDEVEKSNGAYLKAIELKELEVKLRKKLKI